MSKSMVEKYEQVLAGDPASTVFVELAKALIERGDHGRAIEVCQGGLNHHPKSVVGRVLWGKALIQLGKPSEAMNQFDLAVNIDKDNPHAYNLIGEVLLHKGLYRSALPILRKAAALQPNDGRIRQWLEQTRAALAGGPAPVLGAPIDLTPAAPPRGDDPHATAVMGVPGDPNAQETVSTKAYTPDGERANGASSRNEPIDETGDLPTQSHALGEGADPPTDSNRVPNSEAMNGHGAEEGRTSPTQVLTSPEGAPRRKTGKQQAHAPVAAGDDDDPFANVPKRSDSSEVLGGMTATFNALSEDNDTPGIPVDPFAGFPEADSPSPPVAQKGPEPSVVPSPELMRENRSKAPAGLLGDVPDPSGQLPHHEEQPVPGFAALQAGAAGAARKGGLLDDIPDVLETPSHLDVPKVEVSTTATEAIAKEYERELREKLAASTAKKTFLQRHGLKLALLVGALVVVVGAGGSYLYTRSSNRGLDLAGAVAEGRKALNADTPAQYREGLKALELAQRMDSDNPEVQALIGYAHAMLYAQLGHSPDEAAAAKTALAFGGVRDKSPELCAVADLMLADSATVAAAKAAILTSQIEKAEVHGEAGRLLLADKKPDDALKRLTRAVELMPGNVRALVALGDYYLSFEDWENAVKIFTGVARQLSPQNAGRVLGLAEARLALGRELPESLGEVEPLLPENVPVAMRARREVVYGQLLSAAGRHEDALKVLTAAEKNNDFRDAAFDVQLALGFAYRSAGQMDAAQRSYETAVKLAPANKADAAKEGLGRVLIARSREKDLLKKIPRETTSRPVSLVRGIAYGRLNDWRNAREELTHTQVDGKYPPESVVQLALADAAENNPDKAINVLKQMTATVKKHRSAVLVALGRVYMQRNELDKAKTVLEEASKDPTDFEGNALLGELLVSLGLTELAVEPLTRAVERNGSHGPTRHLLGRTLLDLGKVQEALKQGEAWAQDNPTSDDALKDYAFFLFHAGRAKDAEAAILKSVKADSLDPEAYRIKAQILFARGELKQGIASLERANKLNPKDAETFCEIGKAMTRQGNYDIALKAFEAARGNDPKAVCGEIGPYHARPGGGAKAVKDLTDAKNKAVHSWDRALAYATIARVKLQLNNLKEAREAADDALALAPFLAPPHYASGLVAMRQKDDAKAVEELAKACELDPSWGNALLAYADLLVRQGPDVLPKAIAEYEAFLAISLSESDVFRVRNDLKRLKKKL
jgi:tetratricopeptide (TPR) repeat protein